MTVQVHWHEGLFLQPQHLQTQQRGLLNALWSERRLAWAHPYGVVEARLSSDELENMRVRFDRLRVLMPSGLMVDVPGAADLPALDISEAFAESTRPMTVSLGVPLWYGNRGNALGIGETDWRVKRLYRVEEHEAFDENTGENGQSVLVRRVNARLILDDDDRTDLEVMPLLRVAHASGDDVGLPRLDPTFVPPCFVLGGSAVLREMLRDLANQVEATRKETVIQLTRGGFNLDTLKGVQVQQMLRLQTLNSYAGRLMPMIQAGGGVSPFDLYLELRGLLGALACLQPDRDAWEAPRYEHDNPGPVFLDLCARIRELLRAEGTATWTKVDFSLEEGLYVAELEESHITEPNEYFLGIRTNKDPRELAKLVEDAREFKLMPSSLARTNIFGVRLEEERHPPLQLPSKVGLNYFRLRRADSQRVWGKIVEERKLALNFKGVENAGFDAVSLYMTVPS